MFWSLYIIFLLFIRIFNFFLCSLNNVIKDWIDDIILILRCWIIIFVFFVFWIIFCWVVFFLFLFVYVIMICVFFFVSLSVIWIFLFIMKLYFYLINNEIWYCYFFLYLVDVFLVVMWKWLKLGGNWIVFEE